MRDFFSRYADRIEPVPFSGCWIWTGSCTPKGYGTINRGGLTLLAHRCAYAAVHGSPDGLVIRHSCDTPCCVNPDHLTGGTYAENTADMVLRGRLNPPSGERSHTAKTNWGAVQMIRTFAGEGASRRWLSHVFDLHYNTVSAIVAGRTWRSQ